jgi:hypothetical protein
MIQRAFASLRLSLQGIHWTSRSLLVVMSLAVSGNILTPSPGFAGDSFSVEKTILAVESTYPNGYRGNLIAVYESDELREISGFRYTDSRGTDRKHTAEDIKQGLVLVHALGKDLLKLRGKDFERTSGGQISLMFYREFLGGDDRRELRFTYQPEGSDWVMRTDDPAGRDLFNQLWIKIKTGFLGTPTGITELKLFESGRQVRRYLPSELPRASQRAYLFID